MTNTNLPAHLSMIDEGTLTSLVQRLLSQPMEAIAYRLRLALYPTGGGTPFATVLSVKSVTASLPVRRCIYANASQS